MSEKMLEALRAAARTTDRLPLGRVLAEALGSEKLQELTDDRLAERLNAYAEAHGGDPRPQDVSYCADPGWNVAYCGGEIALVRLANELTRAGVPDAAIKLMHGQAGGYLLLYRIGTGAVSGR